MAEETCWLQAVIREIGCSRLGWRKFGGSRLGQKYLGGSLLGQREVSDSRGVKLGGCTPIIRMIGCFAL